MRIEKDGAGRAGIERGFGGVGALFSTTKSVVNVDRVLQVWQHHAEQLHMLRLQVVPANTAPQADDVLRAWGDGDDDAGHVLKAEAETPEFVVLVGLPVFVRYQIFAFDDASARIAHEGFAVGVGVGVVGAIGLDRVVRHGHASGGEHAVAECAVICEVEDEDGVRRLA